MTTDKKTTYDFVVTLKKKGDFDTFYAYKVEEGETHTKVYTESKDGVKRCNKIANDAIECITETLKD